MAEKSGRRRAEAKTELGREVLRKLGNRGMSWLAQEIHTRVKIFHDTSYYSHALRSGNFRVGAPELKAVCEILDIDAQWAFEQAGWPQIPPPEADTAAEPLTEELRDFARKVGQLEREDRTLVESFVDRMLSRRWAPPEGNPPQP